MAVGSGLIKILGAADPLLLQHSKDLVAAITFRDGHGTGNPVGIAGHTADQRMIVIDIVEFICAGDNFFLGIGEPTVKAEQPRQIDEIIGFQGVHNIIHGVIFSHGDADRPIRLCQSHDIVGTVPAGKGQQYRGG